MYFSSAEFSKGLFAPSKKDMLPISFLNLILISLSLCTPTSLSTNRSKRDRDRERQSDRGSLSFASWRRHRKTVSWRSPYLWFLPQERKWKWSELALPSPSRLQQLSLWELLFFPRVRQQVQDHLNQRGSPHLVEEGKCVSGIWILQAWCST